MTMKQGKRFGYKTAICAVLLVAMFVTNGSAQAVYSRLDIQQLFTAPMYQQQKDLFVLAFTQLKARPCSDPFSFCQLAGMHGLPAYAWRGERGLPGAYNQGGYCHHGDTLFLPWHRPYLTLMEKELSGLAKTIALQYPPLTRLQYMTAADQLRLPYWDWAASETATVGVPTLFTDQWIMVNHPTDGSKFIQNPLYSYQFVSTDIDATFGYGQFVAVWGGGMTQTRRWPESNMFSSTFGQTNTMLMNSNVMANAPSWRQATYQLLQSSEWRCIATSNLLGCPNPRSLEGLHNSVHRTVGGAGGDLSQIPISSFDPVFWLHHANVDRVLALWQGLNPGSPPWASGPWVESGVTPGTYAIPPGTVDANTPLVPFYKNGFSAPFYTANDVRDWRQFGYTYPELIDYPTSTMLRQRICLKYSGVGCFN